MYVEHTQIRSRLCGAAVHFCFSLVCVRSSRVPVPGPNGLAPRAPVLLLVVIPDRTQLNVYVLYTHLQRTFERHRSTPDIMLNRLAKHSSCGPGDGVGLSTTCGKRS